MAKELFEKGLFLYITAGFAGIGILLRLILAMVYRRLLTASEHMGQTKNKWAKQLRQRFETCYQLRIGVKNVDIFVDKYVYKQRFCKVLLSTWELISGQMKYLCLITASIGGIVGLVTDCGRNEILYTVGSGLWLAALLMIVDNLSGLPAKKELLKVNLKDYLENFLKVRFENPKEYEALQKEYAGPAEKEAGHKESRQLARFARRQKKLERRQAKLNGREQRKKEEEARMIAEIEAKKQRQEKKKAEAMERRRQQLLMMEVTQDSKSPAEQNVRGPVDFAKAAAEKTESGKQAFASEHEEKAGTKDDGVVTLTAAAREEDRLIADVLKEFLS